MKLLHSLSLSLARRLILGFALVLALMIAVAAVGTWSVRAVGAQLNGIVEANNVRIALAHDMLDGINDMAILARNVTMLTDVKVIDAQIKVLKAAEASYQTTQKALQDVLAVSATAAETELMRQIASAAAKTIPLMLEAAQQGSDGDSVSALATLTRQVQPVETVLRARVGELVKFQQDQIGVASLAAASAQKQAQLIQFALVAVALGLGTLVAWQITRSVTQPIGRAIMVAERIAQGDLTSKIEVRIPDETGRLLLAIGAMQDRLRGLVGDIRASADSSGWPAPRSPVATRTFPIAPNGRRATCSRPPRRWSNSAGRCASRASRRARPTHWRPARLKWPGAAACSSRKWWRRWTGSTRPRTRSPTSSA